MRASQLVFQFAGAASSARRNGSVATPGNEFTITRGETPRNRYVVARRGHKRDRGLSYIRREERNNAAVAVAVAVRALSDV